MAMLRQEINLFRYFEEPLAAETFPNWKLYCFCNTAFLAILIAVCLYSIWTVHHLTGIKHNLLQKSVALEKKFASIKSSYPPFFFSQDASKSVDKIRSATEEQNKMLATIRNQVHFTQYLTSLSTMIVPNVWLSSITITDNGANMILKGQSLSMKDLQLFLDNLLREKQFNGSSLSISNAEQKGKNPILTFEISLAKKTL
jgi:hypothetical protein